MDIIELGVRVWAFMQVFGAVLGVVAVIAIIIIYIREKRNPFH